jgi:hypothetical protein
MTAAMRLPHLFKWGRHMKTSENMQIPIKLFEDIVAFVFYLEFSNYKFPDMFNIHEMYAGLKEKQHSINLRKSYSNIIHTKDDKQRHIARGVYLRLKEN